MRELPAALRETLDADFYFEGIGALGVTDSVQADRARAMAAALRWAYDLTPEFEADDKKWIDAIAALLAVADTLPPALEELMSRIYEHPRAAIIATLRAVAELSHNGPKMWWELNEWANQIELDIS